MEGRRVVIAFGHPSSQVRNRNIVNVTVDLSSFGRPKKEKLEPHLRPLREATTPTWSKYFLGHSQPSQLGSQPSQPTIHYHQRETSDVRKHPEDIHRRQRGHGQRRKGSSTASFLAITVGPAVLPWFLCIQAYHSGSSFSLLSVPFSLPCLLI
ncbi:hypothetical protein Taro_003587 [Colocasia esculenta]|uniref:Uncharacterized protein n=1 Tax=Colocasia esculenta TaxID=4460 RepID=A0A843TPD2_COLES|nr:hypothetical protein [Colocasia esculenta]